jgi:hypothetical protein
MLSRLEERHDVEFQVFLSWQGPQGVIHRVAGHCVDLSPSGAKLETRDPIAARTSVLVESRQFGRMGMASIRYCSRIGMKYEVGLQFSTAFMLGSPLRKTILANVLRQP